MTKINETKSPSLSQIRNPMSQVLTWTNETRPTRHENFLFPVVPLLWSAESGKRILGGFGVSQQMGGRGAPPFPEVPRRIGRGRGPLESGSFYRGTRPSAPVAAQLPEGSGGSTFGFRRVGTCSYGGREIWRVYWRVGGLVGWWVGGNACFSLADSDCVCWRDQSGGPCAGGTTQVGESVGEPGSWACVGETRRPGPPVPITSYTLVWARGGGVGVGEQKSLSSSTRPSRSVTTPLPADTPGPLSPTSVSLARRSGLSTDTPLTWQRRTRSPPVVQQKQGREPTTSCPPGDVSCPVLGMDDADVIERQ